MNNYFVSQIQRNIDDLEEMLDPLMSDGNSPWLTLGTPTEKGVINLVV